MTDKLNQRMEQASLKSTSGKISSAVPALPTVRSSKGTDSQQGRADLAAMKPINKCTHPPANIAMDSVHTNDTMNQAQPRQVLPLPPIQSQPVSQNNYTTRINSNTTDTMTSLLTTTPPIVSSQVTPDRSLPLQTKPGDAAMPSVKSAPVSPFRQTNQMDVSMNGDGQRKLNQYVLQRVLGNGSYGIVHLAKDSNTGQFYVIPPSCVCQLHTRRNL